MLFIFVFENSQNSFSCGTTFGPFWSVKNLNFGQKLPSWIAHHTFLQSRHPEVTKNLYYVLFSQGNQKKVSAHELFVLIDNYKSIHLLHLNSFLKSCDSCNIMCCTKMFEVCFLLFLFSFIISFMYWLMWIEKRTVPPTFLHWQQLFSLPLYACMKQIFLTKEDIPLHIRFLKLVYSKGKIILVCF